MRIINLEDLKNKDKLLNKLNINSVNNESELYLVGNEVYKIIDESIRETREKLVRESLKYGLKGIVDIKDFLGDSNNNFLGYVMPIVNGNPLFMMFNKLSFKRKLEIINKLDQIFLDLYDKGFIYIDFHTSNVMINKNVITLLDRDGMLLKDDLSYGFIFWIVNFLWATIISVLYDYDFPREVRTIEAMKFMGLDTFMDERFFLRDNFLRMLAFLENKGAQYFKDSRNDVRKLVLK